MFDVLIRLFNELEYKKYTAEDLKEVRALLIQLSKEYKNEIQGGKDNTRKGEKKMIEFALGFIIGVFLTCCIIAGKDR